jgi:hypothetical protein
MVTAESCDVDTKEAIVRTADGLLLSSTRVLVKYGQ